MRGRKWFAETCWFAHEVIVHRPSAHGQAWEPAPTRLVANAQRDPTNAIPDVGAYPCVRPLGVHGVGICRGVVCGSRCHVCTHQEQDHYDKRDPHTRPAA